MDWNDVNDRMPDAAGDYLVLYTFVNDTHKEYNEKGVRWLYPEVRRYDGEKFRHEGLSGYHVLYWMNLPALPSGEIVKSFNL